ncbi:GNAT family N-acetyltransferase [Fodinicola feengrottensis]|uniref:GNAT family N-acetyltransferase n=1 Tax=Fodinicola feengrottensis TaxID=435914 RepID=A0ABN2GCV4_9ACTN|nr:GNAT family N-acetyltransferase [Fodinicola feengrottensis]
MTVTAGRVGKADVTAVSAVLTRAFMDDPVMSWMMPDDAERDRRLPLFFQAVIRHEHLRHHTVDAAVADGAVRGAALWKPPGGWQVGWLRALLSMPAYLRAFGPYVKNAGQVQEVMAKTHPHEPHWYLSVIGTDPTAQGTGVGTGLITSRLAACDRDHLPAYLESSKESNVPYYARFGFEVTREIQLPSAGPTLWAMWRQPR